MRRRNLKSLVNVPVDVRVDGRLRRRQESGGLLDTIVLQVASLYGINVNSTRDLLPAIFMKAFTDVTVSVARAAISTKQHGN